MNSAPYAPVRREYGRRSPQETVSCRLAIRHPFGHAPTLSAWCCSKALASRLPIAARPVTRPADFFANQPKVAPAGVVDEDLGAAVRRALRPDPRHARAHALRFSWQFGRAIPRKIWC